MTTNPNEVPKDGKAIVLGAHGGYWIGKWLPVYQNGCVPTHWQNIPPPVAAGGGKPPYNKQEGV